MLGDQSPNIKLGSVIYGRVSGYPWWPAVVAKCPNTHQWTNGGKFWVSFFNDTNGAWLKASQIRSFDRYNHDLCREHNSGVAKFRRYQERVNKAVSIAETHITHSSKAIRVKLLPPKRSLLLGEESRSDTAAADNVKTNQHVASAAHRPYSKRRPPLTRRRESGISDDPLVTQHDSAETEDRNANEHVGVSEARPKRKRMRSIRYLEHSNLPESKALQKLQALSTSNRESYPVLVSAETEMNPKTSGKEEDHSVPFTEPQVQARRRSLRLRSSIDTPSESGLTGKRSRRKRVRSLPVEPCKEQLEGFVNSSTLESSASVGSIHRERSFEKDTASAAIGQAGNKTTRVKGRGERMEENGALTKHLYVSELKEVARKSNGKVPYPASGIRGVRSLVGVRSRRVKDVDKFDDCTDSEERPERERKVNVGSLEVAAEDLVEYAIRGCRSDSSDPINNVPGGRSIAFSNGDVVSSILNRLSNLEKDVSRLNKRATSEQQATLGEDATAAGVKSAVEALAAASAAFAKARDYNVAVIRRSVQVLWPDGQFPLAGADGDLLRTVAQSLILASCKRRQAEVTKVANETLHTQTPCHETGERGICAHCLVPPDSTPVSAEETENSRYEKDRQHS